MTPTRRIDTEAQSIVEGLAMEGRTAGQIQRELIKAGVRAADRPSLRTIQRIVHDMRLQDRSGPWSLSDATGDEAGLILPVLRAYLNLTALREVKSERDLFITKAEARWIVRVRRAAPNIHPFDVYRLTRAYLAREERGLPTYDLDAMLAFTPWDTSPRHDSRGVEYTMREVYEKGVRGGTIPAAPPFLMMVLAQVPWTPRTSDWDLFRRALYGHDPDAWEAAGLHPPDEPEGEAPE
jgi:hypothetical protein